MTSVSVSPTIIARRASSRRSSTSSPSTSSSFAVSKRRRRGSRIDVGFVILRAAKSSSDWIDSPVSSGGGFSSGGGNGGDDGWERWGWGPRDEGDGDAHGAASRFNAWMRLFVAAVVLNWTTRRLMKRNDAPALLMDDGDGDDENVATKDDWKTKRVSIVIPARNESKAIGVLLRHLNAALEPEALEIVVSVGDSTDDTGEIAKSHGAVVVSGSKGRACQMNAGAKVATGDYVLFLHADTTPPTDVVDVVRRRLRDQKTVIGGFVSLIETSTRTFWAISYHNVIKTDYCAVISRPFSYLRGFRILFGDQAMFCRRDDFFAVGGFDEKLAIMEDADLCVRMHLKGRTHPQTGKWYRGRVKLLDRVVTTSGRRIETLGNFKATCVHVLIACSWNFGASPERLRKIYDWCYRDVR